MGIRALAGWGLLAGMVAGMAVGQAAPQDPNNANSPSPAQSPGRPADQSPYTMQVNSRVVLTDVTVTDQQGNPVTGLRETDFQVFDNGKPQTLASFEEHREQKAHLKETSASPGSFSNDVLRNPPPQLNVLLFDTTTIGIVDQMYLYEQMEHFVAALPPGEPVAVFTRHGDITVQLCGFTDDHAQLLAAIRRAIPRLQNLGSWMTSDLDTLSQMAMYLSQIPGRKNLVWFTGGSNLYLKTDPTTLPGYQDMRPVYDMLETERIALYPIDVRGLTVNSAPGMVYQQMQMRQEAAATGGAASLNTNGLALATEHVLATDGDYYTLSYAPQALRSNGQWHRVAVKLEEKGYQLSYRHGYFDDGSNQTEPAGKAKAKTRTVLRADGKRDEIPNDRSDPIVFRVDVAPISEQAAEADAKDFHPKRGLEPYEVRYFVPARDLHAEDTHGNEGMMVVGSALLAFNADGEPAGRQFHETKFEVSVAQAQTVPNATITVHEVMSLPRGRNYLYLAVWDPTTGRLGTVNADVDVKKPVAGSP